MNVALTFHLKIKSSAWKAIFSDIAITALIRSHFIHKNNSPTSLCAYARNDIGAIRHIGVVSAHIRRIL